MKTLHDEVKQGAERLRQVIRALWTTAVAVCSLDGQSALRGDAGVRRSALTCRRLDLIKTTQIH
jgi:hypothetical protein